MRSLVIVPFLYAIITFPHHPSLVSPKTVITSQTCPHCVSLCHLDFLFLFLCLHIFQRILFFSHRVLTEKMIVSGSSTHMQYLILVEFFLQFRNPYNHLVLKTIICSSGSKSSLSSLFPNHDFFAHGCLVYFKFNWILIFNDIFMYRVST